MLLAANRLSKEDRQRWYRHIPAAFDPGHTRAQPRQRTQLPFHSCELHFGLPPGEPRAIISGWRRTWLAGVMGPDGKGGSKRAGNTGCSGQSLARRTGLTPGGRPGPARCCRWPAASPHWWNSAHQAWAARGLVSPGGWREGRRLGPRRSRVAGVWSITTARPWTRCPARSRSTSMPSRMLRHQVLCSGEPGRTQTRLLEHPEFRAHLVSCVQLRRVAAAVVRLPGLPASRGYVA